MKRHYVNKKLFMLPEVSQINANVNLSICKSSKNVKDALTHLANKC